MQIILDRRALHQIPELDRCLNETMDYLRRSLSGLGCQVFSPMESCLCAWFDFGRDSAIAFRADADALPITERNEVPYISRHPGRMHACGHDGHMAIVLELARRLDRKERLAHNVLLVFQCAEETTGGARDLCETGIFEQFHVQAVFALHLWPGLAPGTIASRKNEMMSRSCEVHVQIHGRSAHIAKASEGLDALAAGVEFYCRAAQLEASLPDHVFRLLKFGKMVSGTVGNAISSYTKLEGSLRTYDEDSYRFLLEGMHRICHEVTGQTGCRVELETTYGYPAVINPPELYDRVFSLIPFFELAEPSMTSEDFSFYQQRLPGMLFFLGVGDTPPLHSERFDFDERILLTGADFFERLAENFA